MPWGWKRCGCSTRSVLSPLPEVIAINYAQGPLGGNSAPKFGRRTPPGWRRRVGRTSEEDSLNGDAQICRRIRLRLLSRAALSIAIGGVKNSQGPAICRIVPCVFETQPGGNLIRMASRGRVRYITSGNIGTNRRPFRRTPGSGPPAWLAGEIERCREGLAGRHRIGVIRDAARHLTRLEAVAIG